MFAITSLLIVLVLSVTVTKIATVALTHTGLSEQTARFQARSAFTGVGFTTSESEKIVNHPVRRRILMLLMICGNAGIISAISALILGFVHSPTLPSVSLRLGLLVLGLVVLWALANSRWADDQLSRIVGWAIQRWTDLDVRDYAALLRFAGDYAVIEMAVEDADWICDSQLKDLRLADEGVLVLGIERADKRFVGAPSGKTRIHAGDTVILYGQMGTLRNLDSRPSGAAGAVEHEMHVAQQERLEKKAQNERPNGSTRKGD